VAVPVRRTWIVVLLAAVFLMHGIPSMAAEQAAVPASHVGTSTAEDGVDLLLVAAVSSADEGTGHDEEWADHGSTSHSLASHAWNACLAVLLMGMALLAAAAFRRLPSPRDRRVTSRVRGSVGWVRPPRPPDLAALCLLRT
jgi:putative copper export protein